MRLQAARCKTWWHPVPAEEHFEPLDGVTFELPLRKELLRWVADSDVVAGPIPYPADAVLLYEDDVLIAALELPVLTTEGDTTTLRWAAGEPVLTVS